METFKIVVDGVKLSAKQRKQIEAGFEKVFLEALGPAGEEEVRVGPFPSFARVKAELINGRYAILAALAGDSEIQGRLNQVARANSIEKAALDHATVDAKAASTFRNG